MHSEVSIHFSEQILSKWLTNGLPAHSDPATVLAQTYFSNSPDILSSVIYARLETTFVYLLIRDDSRSVRIHVEGRASKEISDCWSSTRSSLHNASSTREGVTVVAWHLSGSTCSPMIT